jgi:hypothetical protein
MLYVVAKLKPYYSHSTSYTTSALDNEGQEYQSRDAADTYSSSNVSVAWWHEFLKPSGGARVAEPHSVLQVCDDEMCTSLQPSLPMNKSENIGMSTIRWIHVNWPPCQRECESDVSAEVADKQSHIFSRTSTYST